MHYWWRHIARQHTATIKR